MILHCHSCKRKFKFDDKSIPVGERILTSCPYCGMLVSENKQDELTTCPVCYTRFQEGDGDVICPSCGTLLAERPVFESREKPKQKPSSKKKVIDLSTNNISDYNALETIDDDVAAIAALIAGERPTQLSVKPKKKSSVKKTIKQPKVEKSTKEIKTETSVAKDKEIKTEAASVEKSTPKIKTEAPTVEKPTKSIKTETPVIEKPRTEPIKEKKILTPTELEKILSDAHTTIQVAVDYLKQDSASQLATEKIIEEPNKNSESQKNAKEKPAEKPRIPLSEAEIVLKHDFSEIPEQFITGIKKVANEIELRDVLDKDNRIQTDYSASLCSTTKTLDFIHDKNPEKTTNKNQTFFVPQNYKASFFAPCSFGDTDKTAIGRKKRGCTICDSTFPCFIKAAIFYKYYQTYHPEEYEKQRQKYLEQKDEIDGRIFNFSSIWDIIQEVDELPVLTMARISEIRKEIDDFKYYVYFADKKLHMREYDVNTGIYSNNATLGPRSIIEYIEKCKENATGKFYDKDQEERRQYLFILQLLSTPEKYKAYIQRIQEIESNIEKIRSGNSYYGCVIGNDRNEVRNEVEEISISLQKSFNIHTSYTQMTAMDTMQMLAQVSEKQPYYKPIKYLPFEDNKIYLITGLREFLQFYNSKKNEYPINRQADHFLKQISTFDKNRFVILAGNKPEIDDFLRLDPALEILFHENMVELKDMTIDEIWETFEQDVDKNISLTEKDEQEFKQYLAFNRGSFPFNNKSLAEYLANYVMGQNKFALPMDISNVRKKNFMEALDKLVGLEQIKKTVLQLYNYARYQKSATDSGIKIDRGNMHMLFTGNPGTGKTTVARILADALYDVGIIKERKLIEVERKDLIAEYLGQTAVKTGKVIEKAIGGILFIDEAYSLTPSVRMDMYGEEALATIVKAMEDYKDDLIIIFAGYKAEMERFLNTNPGMASRIGYTFNFENYEEEDLLELTRRKFKYSGLELQEECISQIKELLRYFSMSKNNGNGRFVDKMYQAIIRKRSELDDIKIQLIDERCIPTVQEMIDIMPENDEMISPEDVNDEEKLRVAYHELGHAIVSKELHSDRPIERITVESSAGGALGYVKYKKNEAVHLKTKEDYQNRIASLMAGLAAEEVMLKSYSNGGGSDLPKAIELAKQMINSGMSILGFAALELPEDSEKIYKQANLLMNDGFNASRRILKERKEDITKLAKTLVEQGTIDGEDIDKLFAPQERKDSE